MKMKVEYYVILDTKTLCFQKKGDEAPIEEADKFATLEDATKELSTYDEFKGEIYKVTEYIDRKFELAR